MHLETRTANHPNGSVIEFHPGPHDYLHDGQKLTSVTTLVKQWFPQFDSVTVAKRKAEREGRDYQALLQEWDRKRDEASSFGTKIHAMVDKIIQENDDRAADSLPADAREIRYLEALKESLRRIRMGYDFVESEKIIFSPVRKVAGTLDLLLRSKTTGEYVVADWKTNREIKYSGFRDEMGSGPCQHLANCNFIHYSLQASAYGVLLTTEGYVPSASQVRGVLLHLREQKGAVVCDYIKTKNLSAESHQILS